MERAAVSEISETLYSGTFILGAERVAEQVPECGSQPVKLLNAFLKLG